MIKICFLLTQVINSGPENVVLDICRHIDQSKYRPIIFSLRNSDEHRSIEQKFSDLGIEIVHFGFSTIDLELRTRKVAKIIKKEFMRLKCNILHVHCYHPQLVASYLNDLKTIVTIHNISGEDFVMKKGLIMGTYMRIRYNQSLRCIKVSVAISDYMLEYYDKICNNIVKISNGVSIKSNDDFNKKEFKNLLNIKDQSPIIIITGSVSARKNVDFAIKELKKSQKDFTCIIVGDGEKIEDCKLLADGDKRFLFVGFKNNVVDYLEIADYYVSASKSEGLPLSVLEALNMGVPSLLSNIKPHEEIVNSMNMNGVLSFNLEVDCLVKTFDDMLNYKFNRELIQIRAKQLYSAKVMTNAYEHEYKKMCNN